MKVSDKIEVIRSIWGYCFLAEKGAKGIIIQILNDGLVRVRLEKETLLMSIVDLKLINKNNHPATHLFK